VYAGFAGILDLYAGLAGNLPVPIGECMPGVISYSMPGRPAFFQPMPGLDCR